ncbi:DNA cytosine methyltransferase [Spiroplasma eriocheiris]|uniref:DNA (cytosine-5-)-methyltransferase n=1 Tax=Spiroplasma eriocheiris TaxID=315358 RepID=A0A0H3XI62_9MOLU|nr:DNA cytosine methyltransferase [Spiroplasma eriocheiris]AHF57683.1 CpG DNA methylase (cytosine-specific methyltransferase) [Spiroplasma eriocheiris CCTCC M 207170]AKM54135.1 hypothetical protein SERIO_v1c05630 [Spiroplasma eriocheiris]
MKFKILETFAGIGAQHKALTNIKKRKVNFDYEIVNISEWDVHALISYDAIHYGNLTANEVDRYLAKNNLENIFDYLQKRVYSNDGKEPIKNFHKKNIFF